MDTKDNALAVIPGMEGVLDIVRPDGQDEGMLGNEHIGREDILIPRLALAQKTSPELDPTSPRYIEGLKFTDLFNSVLRKPYGTGPIYFSILRADKPRWVEFNPLDQGGGVRDPNVPANDPRTQFGPPDPQTGKAEKPKATKFYDFIVLILNDLDMSDPMANVVGLSMKSTAIKVAKQLNLLINQRGKKLLYKGAYELRTASDTNPSGTFAIYKVKNAGWLKVGSTVEAMAAEMFETWKDKVVSIDLDTAHPDEAGSTDFDPATLEAEGAPKPNM